MKKALFLTLFVSFVMMGFAQTQKGFAKTKGRIDNEGNLIPGQPLGEVMVKVRDRNSVLSDKRGGFSFPMPDETYYLESVTKDGYVLTDPDVLSKQYFYSKNKLVIAFETKEQQIMERMENFERINDAQNKMITELRAEVKRLKAENKITEEEYYKRLQEIADMQTESQQLVEEMVDRYSKIDYDMLSEFDRQISAYILNGELKKADSLLKTKGNLAERAENLKKLTEANAKEREELEKRSRKLEKSEALAKKELDDLANDYYHKFEIYKLQHMNDSAAYWLEERVKLDTTNVEWMCDAGEYICEYLTDYDKAYNYYQKSLKRSMITYGDKSEMVAHINNNIGVVFSRKSDYETSLSYHNKALILLNDINADSSKIMPIYNDIGCVYGKLNIFDKAIHHISIAINYYEGIEHNGGFISPTESIEFANYYNNIGVIYGYMGDNIQALESYNKALVKLNKVFNEDDKLIATTYNNIGAVYLGEDNNKAIDCFNKAVNIFKKLYGEDHPDVAVVYGNLGNSYAELEDYSQAIFYMQKASNCFQTIYGESHIYVGYTLNNMGSVYNSIGDIEQALDCFTTALESINIYGENNLFVAALYNNIAEAYILKGNYSIATSYLEKKAIVYENLFGIYNKDMAYTYEVIGVCYYKQNEYAKSLENLNKALSIYQSIGDDNDGVLIVKDKINKVEAKLAESKKKK